jgi:hypothetical protein
MQPYDLGTLGARLGELAEVFERKPLTEKALAVWFDVLKEFPTDRICSLLISWPKTHTKFPTPAEVWKVVNDLCIADRERKAAEENRRATVFHPSVGGEQVEKFIAQIRAILKRPKWTPTEHWQRLLEKAPKDSIGYRFAEEALINLARNRAPKREPVMEREPGADIEEDRETYSAG